MKGSGSKSSQTAKSFPKVSAPPGLEKSKEKNTAPPTRMRLTSSEPISNHEDKEPVEQKVENTLDPLEVSRYPLANPVDVVIKGMQEVKLQQKILKEIKFVASLNEDVLRSQENYWLFTNNIVNEDARLRIKSALELYCIMNVQWISGTELEIDINPDHRIEKVAKKEHKK